MSSVLYQTSPPGPTDLLGLDAHLIGSTATQASPTSSLNRGDVFEIQGPAASGKTLLVYYLVMQCILPCKVFLPPGSGPPETEIGGWEKAAVIVDTDGRWNVPRLSSLLTRRLEKALSVKQTGTQPIVKELVTKSLQRLHVFRPKSSASLAATLFCLPSYHTDRMSTEEIAFLAIDSISSFYWIDRYNLEQQRHRLPDKRDELNPLSSVLIALQEFRLSHGPVTVFTNWGLSPVSKHIALTNLDESSTAPSPFHRQHLHPFPAPFENPPRILPNAHLLPPITHHITLTLPSVNQVPSEVASLQEAKSMASARSRTEGEVKGILRTVETGGVTTFAIGNNDEF